MTMRDWITKLDGLPETLRELEYDRYRVLTDSRPLPVDADFERVVKKLQAAKKKSNKKPNGFIRIDPP